MLQKFMSDFLSVYPLRMPELLDAVKMEKPVVYEDYALLTFSLSGEFSLEEVMDVLEDDNETILLYHHIPSGLSGYGKSCCAYSNPSFGHMYKANAYTNENGMVDHIVVTIYASLEFMCGDLCNDLELHSHTGHFKYQKPKEKVILDFI